MVLILIHEMGHFFTAKYFHWKTGSICLYPYGGVTKLNEKINVPIKEELFVLIMGPVVQCVFFFIVKNFIRERYLSTFQSYHYFILLFNMLPIYPLDGGKLLNLCFSYIFPYKKSLFFSISISYVVLIFIGVLLLFRLSYFFFFVLLLTGFKVYQQETENPYLFEKFLLERRLYSFDFKRRRVVKRQDEMMRDVYHYFKINKNYIEEKEYLKWYHN